MKKLKTIILLRVILEIICFGLFIKDIWFYTEYRGGHIWRTTPSYNKKGEINYYFDYCGFCGIMGRKAYEKENISCRQFCLHWS
jgi:hypothetical protein